MTAPTNIDKQPSNPSYNGYSSSVTKLTAVEKRIFEYIAKSPAAVFPIQISKELNIKIGTVKPVLRHMLLKGVLKQPHKGLYCDRITYDVRYHPLKVHNVRLHFKTVERLESWETTEVIGGVTVYVCFGKERDLVSGRLSYDRGMDRAACMLAIDRWLTIAEQKLGREVKDLVLTTCEVNKDYAGVKLDGSLHCATKKVLKDVLERIYEKEEGVRHEYRLMKNMTLTQFDQIFDQGLDQMLGVASNLDNQHELAEQREAMKFMNRRMLELKDSVGAIQKSIVERSQNIDDVGELRKMVLALNYKVGELTEANVLLTKSLGVLVAKLSGVNDVSSGNEGVSKPIVKGQDYSW